MNARQYLERQERLALARMLRTAQQLGDDLKDASLVPEVARRHPLATVAGAAAVGLVAGGLVRPLSRAARGRLGPVVGVAGLGLRWALGRAIRLYSAR